MLGELSDAMEARRKVANGIPQEYPEYEAMAEVVRSVAEIVMMAYQPEAYGQRESLRSVEAYAYKGRAKRFAELPRAKMFPDGNHGQNRNKDLVPGDLHLLSTLVRIVGSMKKPS